MKIYANLENLLLKQQMKDLITALKILSKMIKMILQKSKKRLMKMVETMMRALINRLMMKKVMMKEAMTWKMKDS